MSQCKWCYSPAIYAAWSPRHGWHDLCQRHNDDLASQMKAHLIETLNRKA